MRESPASRRPSGTAAGSDGSRMRDGAGDEAELAASIGGRAAAVDDTTPSRRGRRRSETTLAPTVTRNCWLLPPRPTTLRQCQSSDPRRRPWHSAQAQSRGGRARHSTRMRPPSPRSKHLSRVGLRACEQPEPVGGVGKRPQARRGQRRLRQSRPCRSRQARWR